MDNQMPGSSHNGSSAHSQGFMKDLENFFETYLHKKIPYHIPPKGREWIVKYGPWIDVVLLVLALPLLGTLFGLSGYFARYAAYNPFSGLWESLSWLIILATFVLELCALPGLFKRSLKAWYLVYYAVLLAAISDLLARDIFSLVLGTAIALYILLQIKEYYK